MPFKTRRKKYADTKENHIAQGVDGGLRAIRALEQPNVRFAPLGISRKDEQAYKKAISLLWDIICRNGKTIDIDTNRLIDDKPFKES